MKVINKLFRKRRIDYVGILSRLKYKRGSKFYVETIDGDTCIVLSTPTICTDTGDETHIKSWKSIKEFNLKNEEEFKMGVLFLCFQQETHEAMEFLKLENNKIFDPHSSTYEAYDFRFRHK